MERGLAVRQSIQEYSKPMLAAGITGIAILTGGVVIEAGILL